MKKSTLLIAAVSGIVLLLLCLLACVLASATGLIEPYVNISIQASATPPPATPRAANVPRSERPAATATRLPTATLRPTATVRPTATPPASDAAALPATSAPVATAPIRRLETDGWVINDPRVVLAPVLVVGLGLVLAGLYSVLRDTLVDWFARMGGDAE